ncbi:MAG: YHS domain-containing protein [Desulfobacterales bacterium]|nr:YHS domain-containing protein [Desulfobacterales bacterium]
MSPLRLLIFGILAYIFYRMVTGPRKPSVTGKKADAPDKIQDVLVEDPVCHTYVPQAQAIQLYHDHQTLYFCSQECCNKFLIDKGVKE